MSNYLQTVEQVYAEAAQQPDAGLCCTSAPVWRFPDLHVPERMLAMNYGCGSTVDPRDLNAGDTILYVGVGGGLEALQFAYFTRRPGGVIAVDPVGGMREKARENFEAAAVVNAWFDPSFVEVVDGNALDLPVRDHSVTIVAQNCLFNVFRHDELRQALRETIRVLKRGGRFSTSDPITPVPLPKSFADDEIARARCLSGCQTLEDYLATITHAGFGRVEVRARFPYRLLHPREFPELSEPVLLESVELMATKTPEGPFGPEIFTGRHLIYCGADKHLDTGNGTTLPRGIPIPVSDVMAQRLAEHSDVVVTEPTNRSRGGCC